MRIHIRIIFLNVLFSLPVTMFAVRYGDVFWAYLGKFRADYLYEVHAEKVDTSNPRRPIVIAFINGVPVRFVIDTGATEVNISFEDAQRAGLLLSTLYPTTRFSVSGPYRALELTIDNIQIGSIRRSNVPAAINLTDRKTNWLGMSFLNRLKGFKYRDGVMYLEG